MTSISKWQENDAANACLDHLKTYGERRMGNIYSSLHSSGAIPSEMTHAQLRVILMKLADANCVTRRGVSNHWWKLRVDTWDHTYPFRKQAAPDGQQVIVQTTGADYSADLDDIRTKLDDLEQRITSTGLAELKAEIARVEQLATSGKPKTIEIHINKVKERQLDVIAHPKLDKVVRLCAARLNCLLIGPAGSGKTTLAEQAAETLGLRFAFISCSAGMSEGQLLGRLVPTGEGGQFEYLMSEFVKCYEEGGLFLFDEVDAADSNTLLVVNTALANGHLAVPNRNSKAVAKKHKDFVCIAAANTFGTGADRQYVGRNQLDEAFLDRFRIGQVTMDYDAALEAAICPDANLRSRLQRYRTNANKGMVRRVISSRFLKNAYVAKATGLTDADIDEALFGGWRADEVAKAKGSF